MKDSLPFNKNFKIYDDSQLRPMTGYKACSCYINSFPPEQNGRHFPDDIFKRIFLNENVRILIQISMKSVPKGLIDNKTASVQVMAWRRRGDKPLPEPMLTQFTDAYMRHSGEMS